MRCLGAIQAQKAPMDALKARYVRNITRERGSVAFSCFNLIEKSTFWNKFFCHFGVLPAFQCKSPAHPSARAFTRFRIRLHPGAGRG